MEYEVVGYDDCKESYELKIQDTVYAWDGKTVIIHVKLPKIQNNNTIKGVVTEEDKHFFKNKGERT